MSRRQIERAFPRLACDVPVTVELSSDAEGRERTTLEGRTANVSHEGVMVVVPERIPPGTRVTLVSGAALGARLEAAGTVVWARKVAGPEGAQYAHGVRLVHPAPEFALRLTEQALVAVPGHGGVPAQVGPSTLDVARRQPGLRRYEVLVRFSRAARGALEPFLAAHLSGVKVLETRDSEVMIAYGSFTGDLRELDRKLAELRHSALVVTGDPRGTFFDFFVSAKGLMSRTRSSLAWPATLPRIRLRDLGIAAALVLALLAVWRAGSVIRAQPPPARPVAVQQAAEPVSSWGFYVRPEHHSGWLRVRAKFGLSERLMLDLFRAIKRIDGYSPGHSLADLTVYPRAIGRALGLLVLANATDTEGLRRHLELLENLDMHYRLFPDQSGSRGGYSLGDAEESFERKVMFVFYKTLLLSARADFTAALLAELRSGSSGIAPQ